MGDHWKMMRKMLAFEVLSSARHKWLQHKRDEEADFLVSRYLGKGSADGGPGDEEIEHADSFSKIIAYVYAFCVTDYIPWLRWITDFDGHEKIMKDTLRTARKYQDAIMMKDFKQMEVVRPIEADILVFLSTGKPTLNADR
ncbi:valine N-monooxygenase 1-like protein [Tanacetum coccineum]